jgi:hypothetical protein
VNSTIIWTIRGILIQLREDDLEDFRLYGICHFISPLSIEQIRSFIYIVYVSIFSFSFVILTFGLGFW